MIQKLLNDFIHKKYSSALGMKIVALSMLFMLTDFIVPEFCHAQEVTAEAKLDSINILPGDQVKLHLKVNRPAGVAKFLWATIPANMEQVEILKSGKIDSLKKQDGSWEYKQDLILTCFDSGYHPIFPFCFRFDSIAGKTDSVKTDAILLHVKGIAVDTTKAFRDIKNIMPAPFRWNASGWFYWLVSFLLLIAGLLLFRIYRRRITAKEKIKPVDLRPAHIIALEALDELLKKNLWQQGDIKLFYSELSDIVRHYIELRYVVPALELTSDELLDTTAMRMLTPDSNMKLKELLKLSDLVKFAKYSPFASDHENASQKAREFILITKPIEEKTSDSNENS